MRSTFDAEPLQLASAECKVRLVPRMFGIASCYPAQNAIEDLMPIGGTKTITDYSIYVQWTRSHSADRLLLAAPHCPWTIALRADTPKVRPSDVRSMSAGDATLQDELIAVLESK